MTLRIVKVTKQGEQTVGLLTEDNQVYHFVKTAEELDQSLRKRLLAINPRKEISNVSRKNHKAI